MTEKYFKNNFPEILEKIFENTTELSEDRTFSERLKYLLMETPRISCEICGTSVPIGNRFCSQKCSAQVRTSDHYSKRNVENSNAKRKETMLAKYGVETNSQRQEVKKILSERMQHQLLGNSRKFLEDSVWLYENYVEKQRNSVDIADEIGCHNSTVLEYCRKHGFHIRQNSNYSSLETKIQNYLKSLEIDFVIGDRTQIAPKELDIFIPSKNLAIEVNGLYWHSSGFASNENKCRHLEKYEKCALQGIDLLQFFDDELENKFGVVQSIISAKLGKNSKIFARKCEVRKVESKFAKVFMNENHLQGFVGGSHVGLFHGDICYALITYGKSRFDKKYEYELLRFATKQFFTVVGGFSKLLKNCPRKMLTYADRRYSSGKTYSQFGKYLGESSPGYFWWDKKTGKRISRYSTQKHKLPTLLKNFDETLTENENMFANGFRQVFDCGNLKYELI